MTDQITRPPLAERVSEKIGMAKWMTELYFQTAAIVTADKRYKTLPQYTQSSVLTTIFIATKEALDSDRAKKRAEKLMKISEEHKQLTKIA